MTEPDDDRELRKWAVALAWSRATGADQAVKAAEMLVKYVKDGEAERAKRHPAADM